MSSHEDIRDWTPLDFVKVGGGVSLLLLGCLVVLAVGRRQSARYADWVETPCLIVSASLMPHNSGDRGSDVMLVSTSYRYEFDGVTYDDESFGMPQAVGSELDGRIEVAEFLRSGGADGTADRCYVDPDDPADSVFRYIAAGEIDTTPSILVIPLGFFLLVALYGAVRGVRHGFR